MRSQALKISTSLLELREKKKTSKLHAANDEITEKEASNGLAKAILYLEAKPKHQGIDINYLWNVCEWINDQAEDNMDRSDKAVKDKFAEEGTQTADCTIHRAIKVVKLESDSLFTHDEATEDASTQSLRTRLKHTSPVDSTTAWAKYKKRHQCTICKKQFRKKFIFKAHLRSHAGMHPFQCKICGRTYKSHTAFSGHMVSLSNIEFQCEKCGKTFQTRGNLYTHMRSHDEIKRYPCPICGKRSSTSSQNISHLRTHTGEKPHQCTLCGKCFSFGRP